MKSVDIILRIAIPIGITLTAIWPNKYTMAINTIILFFAICVTIKRTKKDLIKFIWILAGIFVIYLYYYMQKNLHITTILC
ncbi:hypothetical protein NRP93_002679 [Clostridium botulinum]|nr:hypothetical protein [Clostridium botulinum]